MYNMIYKSKSKKNNKGFSLVELIVVILIIAIIAVALAPQVMKYVGQARSNTSDNTMATIKTSVQAAVAEYQGEAGAKALEADGYTLTTTNGTCTLAKTTSGANDDATPSLETLIGENIGSDGLDANYTITITADGVVTVAVAS